MNQGKVSWEEALFEGDIGRKLKVLYALPAHNIYCTSCASIGWFECATDQ